MLTFDSARIVRKRQFVFVFFSIFLCLLVTRGETKTAEDAAEQRGVDGISGSASGIVSVCPNETSQSVAIPMCPRDDEFLTSNGTHLLCRRIRK